ncbi:hypothetical protein LCGC14_1779270 [marine sediment metagenome]|uniref:Uncharacterized protein n=1 Tax=marine sediment metagenome TaxID=412755 RepID=A0A0F9GW00_9ZZZZ
MTGEWVIVIVMAMLCTTVITWVILYNAHERWINKNST